MKLEMHKVTWYSKMLAVILFVLTFYIGYKLGIEKGQIPEVKELAQEENIVKDKLEVSIEEEEINEPNFTGSVVSIKGESLLALSAQAYVQKTLKEFKEQADKDVPEIRAQFGADNPSSNYNLNIRAKYLDNSKTESIVLSVYNYTGGAHGSSYYKVFTVSKKDGKIIPIYSLIKKDKVDDFVLTVKKAIYAWRPEKEVDSPVFGDVVEILKLEDFSDWSMNEENIIIYFSQYSIGPGVLGQVEIKIPIDTVKAFLSDNLQ